jgi:hypothetical protein
MPWAPLRRPLSQCTLAIIGSSAYADPAPRLGFPGIELCSFRTIAGGGSASEALAPRAAAQDWASVDHDLRRLHTVAERAAELVASGSVGSLTRQHLFLAGAVDSRSRLLKATRSVAARRLRDDGADAALLVPM